MSATFDFSILSTLAWPQLIWLGAAFLTLLTSVWRSPKSFALTAALAALAYAAGAVGAFCQYGRADSGGEIGSLIFDGPVHFFTAVLGLIGLITVLLSYRYWKQQDEIIPEVFPLMLFSSVGMALMTATYNLLTLILALEIMSLCLYILVAIRRHDARGSEAAFKYFLLGAASAAFTLMGMAWLYGATGSLDALQMLKNPIAADFSWVFRIGALLVLLGLLFKVAAVPLHFWAPDVYAGAPMPMVGFMAAGVKVAAFGALIRLSFVFVQWEALSLVRLLTGVAIATMLVGSLVALKQKSLKRILAYSSIANAGYLLLGLAGVLKLKSLGLGMGQGDENFSWISPLQCYLAVYALLSLGIVGILTLLSPKGREIDQVSELKGLAKTQPLLAALLSLFLIGLAGIPPMVGFFAKYYLFSQAVQAGLYTATVIGVLASAASLYYYLGPVVAMYFSEEEPGLDPQLSLASRAVLLVLSLFVLYVGIFPKILF